MKAQVITTFGDPSIFKPMILPVPEIKSGHVLIKVAATSVNQIDCKIRSGVVPDIAPRFPAILHGDVAGTIEAVAKNVTHFKVGDEVYGCAGGVSGTGGALAEYMLADARLLAKKPAVLSMSEAAALPLVSITAWDALVLRVKLKRGMKVLVHGGAGGVGHIAVQLAKWCGAKVYATVLQDEQIELVKSLGADEVINVKTESVDQYVARLTKGLGFQVVFDTIGGSNLDSSFIAAALHGSVVTTAARSTHDLTPMHNKGLSLHVVFMLLPLLMNVHRKLHGKILTRLADEVIDIGKLKPLIDPRHFTLDKINEAHALLESGKAQGKIVVTI